MFGSSYLQFGNNPVALAEWFVASAALILLVTMVYIFILNKSPPPETMTQMKLETLSLSSDPAPILTSAQDALKTGDTKKTIEQAVKAVRTLLANLLRGTGADLQNMNVSDMAYLVQTKATRAPDITQPIYQLNLLNLKAAQSQPINLQEAEWSVNTANWLSQLISAQQISLN